ncbi:phage nozzle protein [Spartinivicinus ruber]|uniref:phage nozzle protein n=1 Tax=Spartinivicinus ruber TaxID=2683272 RepID=UPI0013D01CC0|nr:hypothetical protein [Spartinivicinus ruber]
MLIEKPIPNLINGVSQQPPGIRLPTQCEEQVNGLSSVVYGLQKRPPTEHLARISNSSFTGSFIHTINRDKWEKYITVIANGDIRVFDLNGQERTVKKPSDTTYLKAHDPATAFSAVTVADHTFIVNKERTVRSYDPTKNIKLTPVNQRYQTITITPIVPAYKDELWNREKWFRCWSLYKCRVGGRTYAYSAENGGASGFASYLAAKLRDDTGLHVVNNGHAVEIPLNTNQQPFSVADESATGVLTWDTETYYRDKREGVERRTRKVNPRCSHKRTSGIVRSTTSTRLIGYRSEGGDILPAPTPNNKMGIVHVRVGDYGTAYKVNVNGVQQALVETDAKNRSEISTVAITTKLYEKLRDKLKTNFTVAQKDNVISITAKNPKADFTLTCSDSLGDKAIFACKGRVQSFTHLPASCFHGFTIKVAGENGVADDDYYVQYQENTKGESTSGSWVEVAKPGLDRRPSPQTMPHRLVSNADGSFTFEAIDWDARKAGDEDTAPEPSFINKPLSDIFFFKNRLGLLSDENIIFSELGSYYNFYPATVVQMLDTNPIDIAVTNDTVSLLRHAVPFNETLLLFSDLTQFIIRGQDRLTAEDISVDVTTRFECELKAKPVGAGKNVYFSTRRGNAAGIREYYVDPESKVNDAADITSHCPTYIKGSVRHLSASSNEDMLLTVTDQDPSSLYVYNYYWQGNEKLQSSWSRWEVDGVILAASFMESNIVLVVDRADGVCLERITLTKVNEPRSRSFPTEINLDRRCFIPKGGNRPYQDNRTRAVDIEGNIYEGDKLTAFFTGGAKQDCYIGIPYRFYYLFSEQVATDGNKVAILEGRLQLKRFTVSYVESGFFKASVEPEARPEQTYTFTGRLIGSTRNRISRVPIESGKFSFNIQSEASKVKVALISESHLPLTFQAAQWTARFYKRNQRI